MKNKAGTAAGNPRARADRASPTMNGNPNAQVCLSVLVFIVIMAIRTFVSLSSCFLIISRTPLLYLPDVCKKILRCCTGCVFFCTCCFSRAGAGAQCQGRQPSFGFWHSGPGPGLAQVQLQWQAPQWLIRHCRPPLVRRRRVIPAHLITGHNATPSLPRCLTTAF